MAAPAVPTPADYFALTRVLLVPSVWEEPFGRVAAEALINGIPPLVSDRGSLPHVVGGDFAEGGAGRVLPIPVSLTPDVHQVADEADALPWFEAVCALWDDPALYDAFAQRARRLAHERYREEVSRATHVDYFTSLQPGGHPLPCRARLVPAEPQCNWRAGLRECVPRGALPAPRRRPKASAT
jgi:glycosyltransferase involved in cell wall biosynthesis